MNRLGLLLCLILLSGNLSSHPSWGLERDSEGNLYFADIMHNERGSVWKLTPDGELKLLLSDFHAHNVSLDGLGNLISAHGEEHHTMVRLNRDGSIDTLISRNDERQFFGGNCTFAPWGEIIFCIEGYIWRVDQDGNREKVNNHKLGWNQCLMADRDGYIYAPDIANGRGELWKLGIRGGEQLIATDLITKFEDREYDRHNDVLLGMAQDQNRNTYICEKAGQRVIKIGLEGATETFYIANGNWFPTGLCFANGTAYILEYEEGGNHGGPRITRRNANGSSDIIFDYNAYQEPAKSEGGIVENPRLKNPGWPVVLLFISGIVLVVFVLTKGLKSA